MPVIGFLIADRQSHTQALLAAFRQGLSESGFVEGRKCAIEYRWAEGQLRATAGDGAPIWSVAGSR